MRTLVAAIRALTVKRPRLGRAVEQDVLVARDDRLQRALELVFAEAQVDERQFHVRQADVAGREIEVVADRWG